MFAEEIMIPAEESPDDVKELAQARFADGVVLPISGLTVFEYRWRLVNSIGAAAAGKTANVKWQEEKENRHVAVEVLPQKDRMPLAVLRDMKTKKILISMCGTKEDPKADNAVALMQEMGRQYLQETLSIDVLKTKKIEAVKQMKAFAKKAPTDPRATKKRNAVKNEDEEDNTRGTARKG